MKSTVTMRGIKVANPVGKTEYGNVGVWADIRIGDIVIYQGERQRGIRLAPQPVMGTVARIDDDDPFVNVMLSNCVYKNRSTKEWVPLAGGTTVQSSRYGVLSFASGRKSIRNPDWSAIGASAKDKAKRAREWSKPHAAKAWEATKSGAKKAGAATKRGSKKAAGSLAARLQRYAVANPERPAPMGLSPAQIRKHVASEASTARGHHALALAHYEESAKHNRMGHYDRADYHGQMAHAHESVARSLEGVTRAIAARRK